MDNLVSLPLSHVRKMALLWQDEERAFRIVLAVLKESRRFDLVLKLDTFHGVRRKTILHMLCKHLEKAQRAHSLDGAGDDAGPNGVEDEGSPSAPRGDQPVRDT